jgi:hypothetical protein
MTQVYIYISSYVYISVCMCVNTYINTYEYNFDATLDGSDLKKDADMTQVYIYEYIFISSYVYM